MQLFSPILYTELMVLYLTKKGEKRKLTILKLHANNEISSSSNMHIAREPAKGI